MQTKTSVARAVLALCLVGTPTAVAVLTATDAHASVGIAITVEELARRASAVVVVTGLEERQAYEDTRIFTYTRARVDRPIAGDLGAGQEIWIRSEGGIIDHVGMKVDGEPNVEIGKQCILFVEPGNPGIYKVSARAQGQFPIVADATKPGQLKVRKSGAMGLLLPPKNVTLTDGGAASSTPAAAAGAAPAERLAGEALHDRPLEDVAQDLADTWKRVRAK